jgi:hypothetical protein
VTGWQREEDGPGKLDHVTTFTVLGEKRGKLTSERLLR